LLPQLFKLYLTRTLLSREFQKSGISGVTFLDLFHQFSIRDRENREIEKSNQELYEVFAIIQNLSQTFLVHCKAFNPLGANSQIFLSKFVRFFITLDLKILRLFRFKVLFEADIIKG